MNNKKIISLVAVSIALIGLFIFGAKFYQNKEAERLSFIAKDNFRTFVPDHAMRKGNSEAKVYVVEFFDPECESCREFHPYMHSFMSDYDGKIQWVMRYAPFHGNSIMAVKILEAARMQNKYWEALEIMFQHQPEWGNHHHPRPELIWEYLPRLGIDIEEVKKNMDDVKIQTLITQDIHDGKSLNVRGTPTFFVNGKLVEEFGPDHLKIAIDEAIAETEH